MELYTTTTSSPPAWTTVGASPSNMAGSPPLNIFIAVFILLSKQGIMHARHRSVVDLVPIMECGAPVPDAPADIFPFRRFAEGRIKIGPGLFIGFGIGAKFTQMYRASVIIGPLMDIAQLAGERQRAAGIFIRRQ